MGKWPFNSDEAGSAEKEVPALLTELAATLNSLMLLRIGLGCAHFRLRTDGCPVSESIH
jgi:hypothetical protein